MHDQADELRQLVRQRACKPASSGAAAPLVVVAGGKGGVGTTTTAVNLAVALARQGRRAVFVDADLDHGGNANLGTHHFEGSIVDVLAARRTIHEVLDRGPSGIQVVGGRWASGQVFEPSVAAQGRFIAELKDLAPHADVVVIDAGSARNHFARRLWQAAGAVVMTTATDQLSIMDCYASIKAMTAEDAGHATHILVNRSTDSATALVVQSRIAAACQRFLGLRAHAAGHVPPCADAGDGDGVLVYPARCESARALDRVADRVWAELQLESVHESRQSRAARSA